MSTTAKPYYVTQTLWYTNMQLAAMLGMTPVLGSQYTINGKRSINASATPTSYPTKLAYIGIGRGGAKNIDDGYLQVAKKTLSTNGDLYDPIPVRCVPLTDDLTAAERANYRMREIVEINGISYAVYWFKVITYTDTSISFTQTDANGLETPYTYDVANMSPTAPTIDTNGTVTDTAGSISATAGVPIYITADEIQEVVSVYDNGDLRGAIVNEIGLYTGEDRSVIAYDATNTQFTMTEAIYSQLAFHYTSQNVPFSDSSAILDMTLRLGQDKGITGSVS